MQDESESDFIEDLLSQHEASCSPALAETIASCCLPVGETRLLVLDFLALLALRSPAAFDAHTALLNAIAYKWLKEKLPDEGSIAAALTSRTGIPPGPGQIQAIRDVIDNHAMKITPDKGTLVQQMGKVLRQIRPSFEGGGGRS